MTTMENTPEATFSPNTSSNVSTDLTNTTEIFTSDETALTMTSPFEIGTSNSTLPSDQTRDNTILLYVFVPAAILTLMEIVIFIVLIIRCCAKNKPDLNQNESSDLDKEAESFPVFAVENTEYAGYVLDERNHDNQREESQKSQSKNTGFNKLEAVKQQKPKLLDTAYVDVEIESQTGTRETENDHGFKANATVFVNKAYSHFQETPSYLPEATATSSYAHVAFGNRGDTHARLQSRRHSDVVRGISPSSDAGNDVVYDHTFSVRNRRAIEDDTNYSHISEVFQRPHTMLHSKEADKLTTGRPTKWYKFTENTKPSATDENYTDKECGKAENNTGPTSLSSMKGNQQYRYTEVMKNAVKAPPEPCRRPTESSVTRQIKAEENISKSKNSDRKYEYTQVVKKTNTQSLGAGKTSIAKDKQPCFVISKDTVTAGMTKNRPHEYINIVREK